MIKDYKYRKHAKRMRNAFRTHLEYPPALAPIKQGRLCGRKSASDTTIDAVTIRSQATLRGKKIKPSMPKMPWEGSQ